MNKMNCVKGIILSVVVMLCGFTCADKSIHEERADRGVQIQLDIPEFHQAAMKKKPKLISDVLLLVFRGSRGCSSPVYSMVLDSSKIINNGTLMPSTPEIKDFIFMPNDRIHVLCNTGLKDASNITENTIGTFFSEPGHSLGEKNKEPLYGRIGSWSTSICVCEMAHSIVDEFPSCMPRRLALIDLQ